MKKHKHTWLHSYSTGGYGTPLVITEVCRDCDTTRKRAATKKEKNLHARQRREGREIHKTWHAFRQEFFDEDNGKWKSEGYNFSCDTEKWCGKKKDVHYVHCDDSAFANSTLLLFEHQTKTRFMGTTVLYIPQCTGESPIEFFLYPCDHKSLVTALNKIEKRNNKKPGWRFE